MCVRFDTKKHLRGVFLFGYGKDPRGTDSNGCVDYFRLLYCGCLFFYLFLLYHLPYPFLLKDFLFLNLFYLAIETPSDLLSCLGLKIPVISCIGAAVSRMDRSCAKCLFYLVLISIW